MSQPEPAPLLALLVRAQLKLGMSQATFGQMLGISRSTVSRWMDRKHATLLPSQLKTLVRAVYAVDPPLATEIALSQGETLESLRAVPPPASPPAAPAPAAPPPRPHPLIVDTVVCAAAEVVGQPPASLRPILRAAFERAHAVGLSVEDVLWGLGDGRSGT